MKAKVLHANGTRTIALVFETGEEPMQGLLDFAKRERLTSAHFTAIGAFEDVTLGYFDWSQKDYVRVVLREQVEVLSLVGDVALEGDRPQGPCARRRGQARRDGARGPPPGGARPADPGGHPDPAARDTSGGASTPGRSWLSSTSTRPEMPRCDVCGNIYDKTLSIDAWGRRHTFDCFECAIQLLAPHLRSRRVPDSSATDWKEARRAGTTCAQGGGAR